MRESNGSRPVGCVILAAGEGARFGGGKLLAEYRGESLYRRAFRALPEGAFAAVAVVSGEAEILSAAEGAGYLPVRNDRPREGVSRSIRLGLDALGDCAAVLFLVADQPLLRSVTVERILAAGAAHPTCIVAPERSDGQLGNPCLFPAAFFLELRALEGDRGGRRVISAHPEALFTVPAADDELFDADSREELEKLKGRENAVK